MYHQIIRLYHLFEKYVVLIADRILWVVEKNQWNIWRYLTVFRNFELKLELFLHCMFFDLSYVSTFPNVSLVYWDNEVRKCSYSFVARSVYIMHDYQHIMNTYYVAVYIHSYWENDGIQLTNYLLEKVNYQHNLLGENVIHSIYLTMTLIIHRWIWIGIFCDYLNYYVN